MRALTAAVFVGGCAWMWLAPGHALAQDRDACFAAASQGQAQRDAHKLIEARDSFRVCAQEVCPRSMRGDCAGWLDEVERSLPTVVVSAKDASGASLTDVTVAVDGRPFLAKLEGKSEPLDPGAHSFLFARSDGVHVEREIVVEEGRKDIEVAVVLTSALRERAGAQVDAAAPRGASSPWGWGLGAAGITAIVVAAVAGGVAIEDKAAAHCDATGQCDHGPLSDARTAARVADVGLVAGGVLLASGAAVLLWSPGPARKDGSHADGSHVAGLRLAPSIGAGGAGLLLGADW